ENDLLLHIARQMIPNFFGSIRAVEKYHSTFHRVLQYIESLKKTELVNRDKTRFMDQVCALDRPRAEAQMRYSSRSRFLGVVNEVTLSVIWSLLADDLNRVLIRAHGPVRTKPPKHRSH